MKKLKKSGVINKEKLESMRAYLFQGNRIADLIGATEEELKTIYNNAEILFSAGKFQDAAMLAGHLFLQDHRNDKYWALFGMCMVHMKAYEHARVAFGQAMNLNIKNPAYPFYLAQVAEIAQGVKAALPLYRTVLEVCDHVKDANATFIRRTVLEKLRGLDVRS